MSLVLTWKCRNSQHCKALEYKQCIIEEGNKIHLFNLFFYNGTEEETQWFCAFTEDLSVEFLLRENFKFKWVGRNQPKRLVSNAFDLLSLSPVQHYVDSSHRHSALWQTWNPPQRVTRESSGFLSIAVSTCSQQNHTDSSTQIKCAIYPRACCIFTIFQWKNPISSPYSRV